MRVQRILPLAIMSALCFLSASACGTPTPVPIQFGQHPYTHGKGQSRLNYLLFLPQDYGKEPGKIWPLMVFLHGIAKRGDTIEELEELKKDGPPMIVEDETTFPFIVLSPQCPSDSYWDIQIKKVDNLVTEIATSYAVDPDRIYLTGLSMGGYGAWHYALAYPNRYAAVVPIAGGFAPGSNDVPKKICDLKNVPIWAFHGAQDDVVLPQQSQVLVDALEACQGNVKFTLYPEANHDGSWKLAYSDPELYDWLLAQRLR